MQTLIVGLAVGAVMGAVATVVLVVDPLRRQRDVLRDRIVREQMRTFAMEGKLIAERTLRDAPGHNRGSVNVTPIRVVPEPLI